MPYMPPQGTPQYPGNVGPVGGGGGGNLPAYMTMQTSSVKAEPVWSQDSRYGMGPSVPGPSGGPSPAYGGPGYPGSVGMGMPPMPPGMDNNDFFSIAPHPTVYSPTPPPQPITSHMNPSTSLLAQHLSSAPLPPPPPPSQQQQQPTSSSQQPSHLSQLLQQPIYPGGPPSVGMGGSGMGPGGMGGPGGMAPGGMGPGGMTQMQHAQMMAAQEARMAQIQFEAMRAQHVQQQQAYQAHQDFLMQQQQQTRAAQLQAEQAAAAAAMAAAPPPPGPLLAPPPSAAQQQGFPPSASSSHSAYSAQRAQFQEMMMANQMMPMEIRDSPHQKDVDLEKFTTGELCQYGRELVNELNYRTSQLTVMLKKVMERKSLNQGENPNDLSEHCQINLQRMSDIRQIIEKRRQPNWKRLTGDEYIELMLDDSEVVNPMDEKRTEKRADLEQRLPSIMSKTPPNEGDVHYQGRWIPETTYKKYMKFEANKTMLKGLATKLKAVAWKIDVTSPGHLKKVDQTKTSRKKNDDGQQS